MGLRLTSMIFFCSNFIAYSVLFVTMFLFNLGRVDLTTNYRLLIAFPLLLVSFTLLVLIILDTCISIKTITVSIYCNLPLAIVLASLSGVIVSGIFLDDLLISRRIIIYSCSPYYLIVLMSPFIPCIPGVCEKIVKYQQDYIVDNSDTSLINVLLEFVKPLSMFILATTLIVRCYACIVVCCWVSLLLLIPAIKGICTTRILCYLSSLICLVMFVSGIHYGSELVITVSIYTELLLIPLSFGLLASGYELFSAIIEVWFLNVFVGLVPSETNSHSLLIVSDQDQKHGKTETLYGGIV